MDKNTILSEKRIMKTPITISISLEARQIYEKLKGTDFKLSEKVDNLIKEEGKKRKIKV